MKLSNDELKEIIKFHNSLNFNKQIQNLDLKWKILNKKSHKSYGYSK